MVIVRQSQFGLAIKPLDQPIRVATCRVPLPISSEFEAPSARKLLLRARPLVMPFARPFVFVVLLALVSAVLAAGEPLLLKRLFDELGGGRAPRPLLVAIVSLLAFALGRELLGIRLDTSLWRVRIGVHYAMTRATVDRLHALPLEYHRNESVGGLMTKIDRGINGSVAAFSDVAFNLVPAFFFLLVAGTTMFMLDWRLSLAVLVFIPVPPVLGALASREQAQRESLLLERWSAIFGRLNEVLSGILVVKSFATEDQEKRRFLHSVQETNDVVLGGVARDARSGAAKGAAVALARIAALAVGAGLVSRDEMTLGTLVAFMSYAGAVFGPVQGVTGIYQTFRRGIVSLESVFSILDAPEAVRDRPDAIVAKRLGGKVEFVNVEFAYRRGSSVFHDICLRAEPGETVALVGASGSGKTTAIQLLQRLYDPCRGSVRIDGVDVRNYDQRSLRRQIGAVLQDGSLFHDSIRENIALRRSGATSADVERAARDANAHDFIMAMPEGYETKVGERGAKLSAGQRQRIAIARALLEHPPILVLDEATNALDAESEALVEDALARLARGRTTIVIAHRLSTVRRAESHPRFSRGEDRGGRAPRRADGSGRVLRRTRANTGPLRPRRRVALHSFEAPRTNAVGARPCPPRHRRCRARRSRMSAVWCRRTGAARLEGVTHPGFGT